MMTEMWHVARAALFLEDEILIRFRGRRDVFLRGLLVLVVVSLAVGLVGAVTDLAGELVQLPLETQERKFEEGVAEGLANIPGISPEVEESLGVAVDYARAAFGMGIRVAQLPTPLPYPMGSLLRALAQVLSAPLNRIAGWMLYAMIVLVVAKAMGGRGTVQEMLGCTALYAVPHFLNVLGFIRCVGGILWLVSVAWGAIIYVKAVAIAHEFDTGRALVAVVLPVLVLLFLALLVLVIALVMAL